MAIDASVLQTIGGSVPDFAGSQANAYKLKDMQDAENFQTTLAGGDMSSHEGRLKAFSDAAASDPAAAMQMMREEEAAQASRTQTFAALDKLKSDDLADYEHQNDVIGGALAPLVQQADDLVAKGMSPEQANQLLQPAYAGMVQQLMAARTPRGQPILGQSQIDWVRQHPNATVDDLRSIVNMSENGRKTIDEWRKHRMEQTRLENEQHRLHNDDRRVDAMVRSADNRAVAGSGRPTLGAAGRPPANYYWNDPNDPSKGVKRIPGTEPGPKIGSAIAALPLNRILGSAELATADIENMARVPVGEAGSGMIGFGRTPDGTILGGSAQNFRNHIISEDVDNFETMLTGLSRNLAAIEGQGAATGVAKLADKIEGQVSIRRGDTYYTRAMRMAQIRQVVDHGLIAAKLNKAASPEQIARMNDLQASLATAIPYTVKDLQLLRRVHSNNPETTLGQLLEQTRSPSPAGASPSPPPGGARPAAGGGTGSGLSPQREAELRRKYGL